MEMYHEKFRPGDRVERFIRSDCDDDTGCYGVPGVVYTVSRYDGGVIYLEELLTKSGERPVGCVASAFRHVANKDYDPYQQPYEDSDI